MNKFILSTIVLLLAGVFIYYGLRPEAKVESVQENGAPIQLDQNLQGEKQRLMNSQNIPKAETDPSLTTTTAEDEPSDNSRLGQPSAVPPDSEILRADHAQAEALRSRLAADSRIQGAAIIEAVECDSGTCLVSALAKPSMEEELQTAFTLFQRDYPEFGSKFKMEISSDAQAVSTFMFAP